MAYHKENTGGITSFLSAFLARLSPREREVVRSRYGLDGNAPQTLQAIGNRYRITRERVRQIEHGVLASLRAERHAFVGTFVKAALAELDRTGGVAHETAFWKAMQQTLKDKNPVTLFANAGAFLLELSGAATLHSDPTGAWHPFWHASHKARKRAEQFVVKLASALEKRKQEVLAEKQFDVIRAEVARALRIPETHAAHYVTLSHAFVESPFGEMGLASWAEVHPRTARDWAYLVLKREGKPMHFSAIAAAVGVHRPAKYTNPQTVHNELIKDSRFVLVGRGLYGLRESGLIPGTAREIISHVLRREGPLHAQDVVNRVREQRVLKDGTIFINLQNKKHFTCLPDGRYCLREA